MKKLTEVIKKMDFDFFGAGLHKVTPAQFLENPEALLVDIRSREEIRNLQFPMADFCEVLTIPLNELPDRLNEIPGDRDMATFCSSGVRSVAAYLYLKTAGFDRVRVISGGYGDLCEALMPGKVKSRINANK